MSEQDREEVRQIVLQELRQRGLENIAVANGSTTVCAKCGGKGQYQVGYSVTSMAVCECQKFGLINPKL